MGQGANHGATGAAGSSRRWRTRCGACDTDCIDLYQIHRHEPGTDIEETLGALTDLIRQGKVRDIGSSTFPPSAIVEAQWVAERRLSVYVCEQPLLDARPRHRARRAARCAQRYGMGVVPEARWQAVGCRGGGAREAKQPGSTRAERLPQRYDLSLPANQSKLDAADQLAQLADEAGIPLSDSPLPSSLNHPAVTAAIIGPRTMEHLESQLPAAEVVLDEALLDRIDEIVAPGTNINPADAGALVANPGLEPAARRR